MLTINLIKGTDKFKSIIGIEKWNIIIKTNSIYLIEY